MYHFTSKKIDIDSISNIYVFVNCFFKEFYFKLILSLKNAGFLQIYRVYMGIAFYMDNGMIFYSLDLEAMGGRPVAAILKIFLFKSNFPFCEKQMENKRRP